MMEVALYLLPVTLGETPVENVLPVYNKEVILGIKHFIVEDVRSARRFFCSFLLSMGWEEWQYC